MNQEEAKLVLQQILDLLDNRPDDMYDEEGLPTEELNVLVGRIRNLVESSHDNIPQG